MGAFRHLKIHTQVRIFAAMSAAQSFFGLMALYKGGRFINQIICDSSSVWPVRRVFCVDGTILQHSMNLFLARAANWKEYPQDFHFLISAERQSLADEEHVTTTPLER
jgi:hypothetical protein